MIVFLREQNKAQRSALQSVVKQVAIGQFRAASDLEASGQDWEDLGLRIAGRSTVIDASSRSVSARAMCLRSISRRQEDVFDMRPSGEYWEEPPLFFWVTNLFRLARGQALWNACFFTSFYLSNHEPACVRIARQMQR
jgi:hypothetical protein